MSGTILNIDEMAERIFQPIQFKLGGEVYTIEKVTEEALTAVREIPAGEYTQEMAGPLARAIARYIGEDFDPSVFMDLDIRVLRFTLEYINREMEAQIKKAQRPSAGKRKSTR
jgi:hypothetical protein